MAVCVMISWPNISTDEYDLARETVGWEREAPVGGLFHIAMHDGAGFRIVDLWESPEAFQAFVEDRLTPGLQKAGITTEPVVEVFPPHAVFAPGYTAK